MQPDNAFLCLAVDVPSMNELLVLGSVGIFSHLLSNLLALDSLQLRAQWSHTASISLWDTHPIPPDIPGPDPTHDPSCFREGPSPCTWHVPWDSIGNVRREVFIISDVSPGVGHNTVALTFESASGDFSEGLDLPFFKVEKPSWVLGVIGRDLNSISHFGNVHELQWGEGVRYQTRTGCPGNARLTMYI